MTEEKKEKQNFFEITVKAVVLDEKDNILLIKRPESEPYGAGKWDFPGGKLEAGEYFEDGLKREVKEEIGIEVEIENILLADDFGKKYDKKYKTGEEEFLISGKGLRFLAYYKSGEVKISDEHSKFEWVPLEKALEKYGDSDWERDKKEAIAEAQKYIELKNSLDSWKRCLADFENYKKDQARRMEEFRKFTKIDFIMQILPVLDNFHASTDHIPEDQKKSPWVEGIMHIQKQLENVLKDNGVEEIPVKVGDEFNPEIHEAIASDQEADNSEQKKKNKIIKIVRKGYKMNGKVVRAAKVIVK